MPFIVNLNNGSLWSPNNFGNVLNSGDTANSLLQNKNNRLLGAVGGLLGSYTGIPQISQFSGAQSTSTIWNVANPAITSDYVGSVDKPTVVKYYDYRSAKPEIFRRIDGASALTRGSVLAGIYAAASVAPTGVYSVFNLDGVWKTGRGWGDHDNPNVIRNDFTAMSFVKTRWDSISNTWKPTRNPAELITPFTGDKVQVIDFGKRKLRDAYLWKPRTGIENNIIGAIINGANITQDFIKFFFTGPNAVNPDDEDNIIVFRAIISSLDDTFSPSWTPMQMVGRADPNYQYSGYSRSLSLSFKVAATTRDEIKPIWRKLNALAGYTAPEYNSETIAPIAPWMRITIGDLFTQQAIIIDSLSYTLHSNDTIWEINLEDDKEMMQVPHMVDITMNFTLIHDTLPQKNGKFYTLAKTGVNKYGEREIGKHNWLNDFEPNKRVNELFTTDYDTNQVSTPKSQLTRTMENRPTSIALASETAI